MLSRINKSPYSPGWSSLDFPYYALKAKIWTRH